MKRILRKAAALGVALGTVLTILTAPFCISLGPGSSAQVTAGGAITLLPSTSISGNGQSTPVQALQNANTVFFIVSCTAVPVGGAPTLDVYLQSSPDQGTTWRDFAHVTQITTSTVNLFAQLSGNTAGATTTLAASDAVLTVNTVVQGPFGDRLRAKWVFAAGGSSGSYTVSVTGSVK